MSLVVVEASLTDWRAARLDPGPASASQRGPSPDRRLVALAQVPTPLSRTDGAPAILPGDVFLGRVRRLAANLDGCFIDLGSGPEAFLRFAKAKPNLTEGQAVIVEVTRMAMDGKGPRVARHVSLDALGLDWAGLEAEARRVEAPARLLPRADSVRVLAEVLGPGVTRVIAEASIAAEVGRALDQLVPGLALDVWREATPAFEALGVEAQIAAALEPRVELEDGAWLMIEPTEALVAIDVNSGASQRPREAINQAAVPAIVDQIRLRDLGGRIVIDFIDLRDGGQGRRLVASLDQALGGDARATRIAGPTAFGLIEIERQRRGRGLTRDARHAAGRALREIARALRRQPGVAPRLVAGPAVHDWLKARPALLGALARDLGAPLDIILDPRRGLDDHRIEERPR